MAQYGLDTDIQFLPGVGPKRAELLEKELNVSTIGELIRLYPFRYIDRTSFVRIADVRPDMAHVQIRASVVRVELFGNSSAPMNVTNSSEISTMYHALNGNQHPEGESQSGINGANGSIKYNTIKRMSVWIADGSGEMETVFFKGIKWMHSKLLPGTEFVFFGKPTAFNGRINMVHPEVDTVESIKQSAPTPSAPTPSAQPSQPTYPHSATAHPTTTLAGAHSVAAHPATAHPTTTLSGAHSVAAHSATAHPTTTLAGAHSVAAHPATAHPTTTLAGVHSVAAHSATAHPTTTLAGSITIPTVSTVHPTVSTAHPATADNQSKVGWMNIGAGATMTGVYTSSEKLKNSGITGKVMNKIMEAALERGLINVQETLPTYLIKQYGLVPLHFALRNIHFPKDMASLEKARYRLKFEELFYLQLSLLKQKYIRSSADNGIRMPRVGEDFNKCYESLPFALTGAQKRVITEIRNDLKSGRQMNRLLQGDVGSGKTMVAVLSALIAVGNGYQVCIMAPTEVLAQQHFKNITKLLAPTNVKSALLTGSTKTAERREIHSGLEDGTIGIIVGTHALIEDNVIFQNLGMAIIDEQHRFGVEQRAKLWKKASCGCQPHVLVMTATPIPRTLAMTLYGDLDVSVIDELPPGRKPVQTIHATEAKRPALYRFMREQIALGRQVFVVYPLINETEKLDYQSLEKGADDIMNNFPFPEYTTAVVHGKQLNDVKQFNMDAFSAGRANILVATSVIEVGVDVPNASVMVIESAERFGLSQLHQLRGRVGRGSEKSFCVLMTGYKLSKESRHRIELMCQTENGFDLAEEDLKMRGPGDLEGTQQSGLPITLNIASLAKDGMLLNYARECAEAVLKDDPTLTADKNQLLRQELRKDKYIIKDYSKIS